MRRVGDGLLVDQPAETPFPYESNLSIIPIIFARTLSHTCLIHYPLPQLTLVPITWPLLGTSSQSQSPLLCLVPRSSLCPRATKKTIPRT